jgi:hypothetical protein
LVCFGQDKSGNPAVCVGKIWALLAAGLAVEFSTLAATRLANETFLPLYVCKPPLVKNIPSRYFRIFGKQTKKRQK